MAIGDTGEQTFVVIPDEGDSYEVTVDLRDIRLWERLGPRNTMRKVVENPSADDIFALAYTAILRQRIRTVPPLSEWIDGVKVRVKQEPTVAALNRAELSEIIDKALNYPGVTSDIIADHVMDFLESLPGRQPDPT